MKIPRDIDGAQLVKALRALGYPGGRVDKFGIQKRMAID